MDFTSKARRQASSGSRVRACADVAGHAEDETASNVTDRAARRRMRTARRRRRSAPYRPGDLSLWTTPWRRVRRRPAGVRIPRGSAGLNEHGPEPVATPLSSLRLHALHIANLRRRLSFTALRDWSLPRGGVSQPRFQNYACPALHKSPYTTDLRRLLCRKFHIFWVLIIIQSTDSLSIPSLPRVSKKNRTQKISQHLATTARLLMIFGERGSLFNYLLTMGEKFDIGRESSAQFP